MFQRTEAPSLTVANEDLRERVRQAITNQKRPTVTVLSSLLAAQDVLGYIPDEAIDEVAAYTEASINEVWGVASFYKNFRFTPAWRPHRRDMLGAELPPCGRDGNHRADTGARRLGGRGRDGRRQADGAIQHLPRSVRAGPGHQHRPSPARSHDAGEGSNADRQHPGKRFPLGARTT